MGAPLTDEERAAMRMALDALYANSKQLRKDSTPRLELLLVRCGAEAFDPSRRVRAILALRKALGVEE